MVPFAVRFRGGRSSVFPCRSGIKIGISIRRIRVAVFHAGLQILAVCASFAHPYGTAGSGCGCGFNPIGNCDWEIGNFGRHRTDPKIHPAGCGKRKRTADLAGLIPTHGTHNRAVIVVAGTVQNRTAGLVESPMSNQLRLADRHHSQSS